MKMSFGMLNKMMKPLFEKERKMIYGVFGGCYSDWYLVGYFTNKEEANKYCCVCGDGDYYVKSMKNLEGERDLSMVSLKYQHEIVFDYINKKWIMREEPNRYKYYVEDNLRCNNIKYNSTYKWVCFAVNIDYDNRKLAEKIAQDYLAELLSYGDGTVFQENVNLMNKKFLAPFKEKERLKKEAELRKKSLRSWQG